MKTTQILSIQISEITSEKITFNATIGLSHALKTGYGIENPDDILSLYATESTLDWHFVVSENKIDTILRHELIDSCTFDDFTYGYGHAIADFILHTSSAFGHYFN